MGVSIKIVFLGIPPTVNQCHRTIIRNGRPIVISSKEYREFQKKFDTDTYKVGRIKICPDTLLKVTINFHSKWFNKDGSVKKKDVDNRIKPLLDSIEKRFAIPDKHYFNLEVFKLHSEEDKTEVEIEVWDDSDTGEVSICDSFV